VYGLLEGLALVLTIPFPAILAPYKGSIHLLWVAPLLALPIYLCLVVAIASAVPVLRRWQIRVTPALVFSGLSFFGLWTIITVPKLLHPAASVLLALGIAVTLHRRIQGRTLTFAPQLRWVYMGVLGVIVVCHAWEPLREQQLARQLKSPPPSGMNVLVVILDTVRDDRFRDLMNRGRLPNLRHLADEGIELQNVWSTTSWSLPSQASILTGRLPEDHGADWPRVQLSRSVTTLGEFLSARGYATGAFSSNSAWITPAYLGRGFLRFKVYQLEDLLRRTSSGRRIDRLVGFIGYHASGRGRKAASLNADVGKFLNDYEGRPFFAYVCYMDVNRSLHAVKLGSPFWARKPKVTAVVDAYDEALVRLDSDFGELLVSLKSRGLMERTVIAVTSDHGESFGHEWPTDHDPDSHGTTLYPEQSRVPLILWAPARRLAGTIASSGTQSLSFIPHTLTSLIGVSDAPFPSQSLLRDNPEPLKLSLRYGERLIDSWVTDRWQYIRGRDSATTIEELYDLTSDPTAHQNLEGTVPLPDAIRTRLQGIETEFDRQGG
jgi:arylsulfatase A-like enzyme